MQTFEDARQLASDSGFTGIGDLNVDTIKVYTEVRDACAENKCHQYGKNWACPPGCGTLDECADRLHKYKKGLILQTTAVLEDALDFEGMQELGENHGKHAQAFAGKIKDLYPGAMMVGSGGCARCENCTYPDKPCRFPNEITSSMEALGMLVSEVCKDNNIPYYYGPGTLTYVACVLLE
jgi:predicted metal-binding protein